MKKWIFLLLGLAFLKQVIWWVLLPIWQTPDEQAHFAQLQYMIEKATNDVPSENLSLEIATSEDFFGTRRDLRGNNKYTYHPEYKITYGKPFIDLPFVSRTTYVDQEAAGYPPLYYWLATPLYNLVYDHGLIDRVFTVRMLSVILNLGLSLAAFGIGILIWKNKLWAFSLAILVSFQPMVSFVAAGIHPDNLLNLISSLVIWVCLLTLKNGIKLKYLIYLAILLLLGLFTKQFMVFLLPIITAVVIYQIFKGRKVGILLSMVVLFSPILVFAMKLPILYMPNVTAMSPLASMNFWEYLKFRIPKLMFEMWPWYWGVFKWLGIVFPPLVLKIITRVGIVAAVGLGIRFLLIIRRRKFGEYEKYLTFFVLTTVSYILYLFLWDYRLMQSIGFSLGLQGRYLLPNVIPQMILIIVGVTTLFGRFKNVGLILLCLAMIVLNTTALFIIAGSYYDLSSWNIFLTQVVQYKPNYVRF